MIPPQPPRPSDVPDFADMPLPFRPARKADRLPRLQPPGGSNAFDRGRLPGTVALVVFSAALTVLGFLLGVSVR